jgi:sugar phosphate isomerase/epimerase
VARVLPGLNLADSDDVLSIEHEDLLLTPEEGVRRSVNLLRTAMVQSSRRPPPSNSP